MPKNKHDRLPDIPLVEAVLGASAYACERLGIRIGIQRKTSTVDCIEAFAEAPFKAPALLSARSLYEVLDERLRPTGSKLGHCDWSRAERIVNVATSAPYALVGAKMLKHCDEPWARAYAVSQVGVGTVAAAYHASEGGLRKWLRRLDYWSIAVASAVMTRAIYPSLNPAVTVASFAVTPFAPFATSTANTVAMELKYLKLSQQNDTLKKHHRTHLAAGVAGVALFALDEIRPNIPGNHAAWHLLSCYAVHKTLPLIQACSGSV